MSKVSSRTAATIYSITQKGEQCINILVELAEEIRKGTGGHRLEKMVNEILLGKDSALLKEHVLTLPSGATIGIWKNNTLKLSKNLNIDQEKFLKHLVKFF